MELKTFLSKPLVIFNRGVDKNMNCVLQGGAAISGA